MGANREDLSDLDLEWKAKKRISTDMNYVFSGPSSAIHGITGGVYLYIDNGFTKLIQIFSCSV